MQDFFKGLKVVELANVLAGPAVGMFFAELGAEVIKIENAQTGGDTTRHWKMPTEDPASPTSAYFFSVNWGKKHEMLDLSKPDDLEKVRGLLKYADIAISNFKPGSAEKLGLDATSLRKLNPRMILGTITAYGKNDPRPGFDVAMQAETGWLSMNGEAGGPPCKLPVALIDLLAAHQLKQGILLALLKRERTGEGSEVTVSLFDASVSALANQASNWLNLGHIPQRMGSLHPNIAPYGEIFASKDGVPLLLSTGTEQHFIGLCDCLDLADLPKDPRFVTNARRLENRAALQVVLASAFGKKQSSELRGLFSINKLPIVPIRNLEEVFELFDSQRLVLEERRPDGENSKRVKTAVFKLLP